MAEGGDEFRQLLMPESEHCSFRLLSEAFSFPGESVRAKGVKVNQTLQRYMLGSDEDTQQTEVKLKKKTVRSKEQYFEDFLVDMFAGADVTSKIERMEQQFRSADKKESSLYEMLL